MFKCFDITVDHVMNKIIGWCQNFSLQCLIILASKIRTSKQHLKKFYHFWRYWTLPFYEILYIQFFGQIVIFIFKICSLKISADRSRTSLSSRIERFISSKTTFLLGAIIFSSALIWLESYRQIFGRFSSPSVDL